MTASPQTLFDIAGIQARIHTLPGRPPFMTAPELAEVYQKRPKDVFEVVRRHPKRFPDDFAFYLTEAEETAMWPQIAATSARKRDDTRMLCFTHAGAYALSAVLTSDVAIDVGIAIFRAFAAMEAAALAEARAMFAKLQVEEATRRPIRAKVILGANAGLSFDAIWRSGSYSRALVAATLRECHAMGAIAHLPPGMPMVQGDLFAGL